MLHLSPGAVAAIFRMYGLEGAAVREVRSGYRNTSYAIGMPGLGPRNILVYKPDIDATERIKRTNWLGAQLAHSDLPVRYPLDERILRLQVHGKTYYASLYNYLPGSTIPWEAYSMKHIKLLGWAQAVLHTAMQPLPVSLFPNVYDEYQSQLKRAAAYMADPSARTAQRQKLQLSLHDDVIQRLSLFVEACRGLPGSQILHMDFVRGNILFGDAGTSSSLQLGNISMTGIIDFEKAAVGHPLFDIARTLAFLLVDCAGKTQAQTRKYFLYSGYRRRGGGQQTSHSVLIAGQPVDVLETAVSLCLVLDYYTFLRTNPYESLAMNHHFVRTRDILLERGLLQVT